ncbi:hypothetical protein JDFR1000234_48 [uncultured archaeal virus]|uniref:Uncharacterized protein n=1 Tax=uncultured archaeal virus TaxID=1960247 RepID=A0A1S5Y387_9VIRU|nr:hypothetical protein JDFR1000234_48 [uncultured archaeal virus]
MQKLYIIFSPNEKVEVMSLESLEALYQRLGECKDGEERAKLKKAIAQLERKIATKDLFNQYIDSDALEFLDSLTYSEREYLIMRRIQEIRHKIKYRLKKKKK